MVLRAAVCGHKVCHTNEESQLNSLRNILTFYFVYVTETMILIQIPNINFKFKSQTIFFKQNPITS